MVEVLVSKQKILRLVRPDSIPRDRNDDGIVGSISRRLFGCRHHTVSRPFTGAGETYLVCLHCGMRRRFDLMRWRPVGGFYAEDTSR
jgi:hypothetical protein